MSTSVEEELIILFQRKAIRTTKAFKSISTSFLIGNSRCFAFTFAGLFHFSRLLLMPIPSGVELRPDDSNNAKSTAHGQIRADGADTWLFRVGTSLSGLISPSNEQTEKEPAGGEKTRKRRKKVGLRSRGYSTVAARQRGHKKTFFLLVTLIMGRPRTNNHDQRLTFLFFFSFISRAGVENRRCYVDGWPVRRDARDQARKIFLSCILGSREM